MENRYKKRGLNFNSALDSRALRAVTNQQRQRDRRDDVINFRRQVKSVQDSAQVNSPHREYGHVHKQASQHEKGVERYQKLLKWKELKRKHLEKEKKKRLPVFRTGIYHPSPPRFLAPESEHGKTPLTSMKKRPTSGASLVKVPIFHLGGTPATSLLRVPQFHTGVTPSVTARKRVLNSEKWKKPENRGQSVRTLGAPKNAHMTARGRGGVARGRTTHPGQQDEEDLGVKPFPPTPQVTLPRKKVEKPVPPSHTSPLPSFAPVNFTFKFEKAPQSESAEFDSAALSGTTSQLMGEDPPQAVPDARDCGSAAPEENKGISEEDLPMEPVSDAKEWDGGSAVLEEKDVGKEDLSMELMSDAKEWDGGSAVPENDKDIMKEDSSVAPKHLPQEDNDAGAVKPSESDEQLAGKRNLLQQEQGIENVSEVSENDMQLSWQNNSPCREDSNADVLESSRRVALPDLRIDGRPSRELFEDVLPSEDSEAREHPKTEEKTECYQMEGEKGEPGPTDTHTSTSEVKGGGPRRSRVAKRQASCCFHDDATPMLSRLRPRTPCSRKTRRSISAHCDSPWELLTPRKRPNQKTSKRSVGRAATPEDLDVRNKTTAATSAQTQLSKQNTPLIGRSAFCSREESSSPLMTPENIFRREQGMWTVDTSPWITLQRRKKKSHKVSDLHEMFADLPADGLPVPCHLTPGISASTGTETSLSEGSVCNSFLSLLQPSSSQNTDSPEVNVWGEESPANIASATTPKTSRPSQSAEEERPLDLMKGCHTIAIQQAGEANVSTLSSANELPASASLSTSENGNGKEGTKRKLRKSVMFVVEEKGNLKTSTYKMPGTPVRRSSRVSMGLFAKVDLNVDEPVTEDQDLIVFDSPRSEEKTSCTTRRKSSRVSLLPGMTQSPAKEAAPVPADLMTWETPTKPKRAASSLATPVRRSRRLSKAV